MSTPKIPVRPRCDECRWSIPLEGRYDQKECINEDSPEAFGPVECSFSCECFEAQEKKSLNKG